MENQLTRLREFITAHYDLDELRTLCFDLGINFDELRGQTLSSKASALILHVGRGGELENLLAVLGQGRPDDVPALDVAVLYEGLPEFEEGAFPPSLWDRFRRRRLLFYSSIALASLVVLIVVLAGLISIGADIGGAREQLREMGLLPAFTPTPLPFAPAGEDENLILIATFHRTEGVADHDIHNEIRRAIQAAAADLDFAHLRVEVESTSLAADDRTGAEGLGQRYGASMVIWGADTGARVSVSFLNLRQPAFDAAQVQISEIERTQLAAPDAYAKFITTDLPGQLTFLSLFAIGQSYYTEGDYEKSLDVIEKAVTSLAPETEPPEGLADAHFRLGWLYQGSLGDVERAVVNYDRAIELDPDYAEAYNHRGAARDDQGDLEGAIADYDTAIQIDPDDFAAYYNRGNAHYDQGDLAGAIADYDRAIELDPENAAAYNNRGNARYAQGDLEGAIADYDRAIQLEPNDAVARYDRGNARYVQGDLEGAIADYDRAIQLDPDYATAYNNRGLAHYAQGDLEGAIADYDRAIQLDPDMAEAYNNWGNARYTQGDPARAVADFDKAIELDPDYAVAYYNRGNARYAQGDLEGAIADYNEVIELDPDNALAYNNRGLARYYQGDLEGAITDYDRAIELDPNGALAYHNRGNAHYDQGDLAGAIADYDEAIQLIPDLAEVYWGRGLAYRGLGNAEAALADLRHYLELRPDTENRATFEEWIAELEAQLSAP
jgi:tetratricopeptide (TPR) repeat protein